MTRCSGSVFNIAEGCQQCSKLACNTYAISLNLGHKVVTSITCEQGSSSTAVAHNLHDLQRLPPSAIPLQHSTAFTQLEL